MLVQLAWRSGCVMDYHATARGSIPGDNGVLTELYVLRKGQMGVPSLNDLVVDGTKNTTHQPTKICYDVKTDVHNIFVKRPDTRS